MKLIKDINGSYNYITEDRRFLVIHGYPSMFALKCWIVYIKDEPTKYFRTLKEVKDFVATQY